jgi:hypothetical protein
VLVPLGLNLGHGEQLVVMLQGYGCLLMLVLGCTDTFQGRTRDGIYEPVLADSEREAVADLLQYLENVCLRRAGPLASLTSLSATRNRLLLWRTS